MSYYTRKRQKTLMVLNLMGLVLPWVVFIALIGLIGQSCVAAIDKHQEQYELSSAKRTAVVATWTH